MKESNYIILLHDIGNKDSIRIDFKSKMEPLTFFQELKIDSHSITQFIKNEYAVEIDEFILDQDKIEYHAIPRMKKTWFGLHNKAVNDILIPETSKYFYPYVYGNFVYYFSQKKISKNDFIKWLTSNTTNPKFEFDAIYSATNNYRTKVLNEKDFVLVTNHNFQTEFGISGNTIILKQIVEKLKAMNLNNYEEERYKQKQNT